MPTKEIKPTNPAEFQLVVCEFCRKTLREIIENQGDSFDVELISSQLGSVHKLEINVTLP